MTSDTSGLRIDRIQDDLEAMAAVDEPSEFLRLLGFAVSRWMMEPPDYRAIAPILRCLERHPEIESGFSEALDGFLENFLFQGYDHALIASVDRCPTIYTTGLLNRLLLESPRRGGSGVYLRAMQRIMENGSASLTVRGVARRYWES